MNNPHESAYNCGACGGVNGGPNGRAIAQMMNDPRVRQRLAARGLTSLIPEVDRTNLNGIIFEELCRGIVREESRRLYISAIERLAARGAEAVILGCTEITMLIDDSVSPLPVYDTTDLHARALVDAALA